MQETWVLSLGWEDPLGEEKGLPTPVFQPGEFHGLYSLWGRKESDTTEQISFSLNSLNVSLSMRPFLKFEAPSQRIPLFFFLALSLSPSSYCLLHDRPVNRVMSRWEKEWRLIWKARKSRRWGTLASKEPSCLN